MTTSPTGVLPSGTDTSCAARHGNGKEIQPWRRSHDHHTAATAAREALDHAA
jgi:hypothetical protein